MIKKIILLFILWKVLSYGIVLFVDPLTKSNLRFTPTTRMKLSPPESIKPIWAFGNFDGVNYLEVAKKGYTQYELGFFPLYPVVIKIFTQITLFLLGHKYALITAELISNISLLLSLILFYKLLQLEKKTNLTLLLTTIVLLYPTSFFYAAIYNDAFFLLLATLSMYFARKQNWIVASLFGALATLTRLNGLPLFFFILVEYILQKTKKSTVDLLSINFKKLQIKKYLRSFSPKIILKDHIYAALLVPLAFIAYLVYIQIHFGSYTMLFTSMKPWGQDKMVFPLQVVWRYIKIIFFFPTFKFNYWIAVLELLSFGFYLGIIVYSFKRIRFSYWVFLSLAILIPSLTGSFQGMPRYSLHLLPFFLTLSILLKDKNTIIKALYFFFSILLHIVLLISFTNGYFVA